MKKFIAVAAILSVMFLGAGTSQALMGVPDAVPGRDVLIPFFMVSMDGHGNENSLITITEVKGINIPAGILHLTVWDVNSKHVYDKEIKLTPYDVYPMDAKSLINEMSADGRDALRADLDGDGTFDHWVGYIYLDNEIEANHLIAHAYQISVADGIVAGYLPPALEHYDVRHDPMVQGYPSVIGLDDFDLADVEAFNADALWAAKMIELGEVPVSSSSLTLYPRFYVNDAASTNMLVIWTDREAGIPLPGRVTVDFYNEAELPLSAPITIDHELNLIDITRIVPDGLYTKYPHGGWIDLDLIGGAFNSQRYLLAYSIQRAMMADSSTLDVIFEAHRDAEGSFM